MGAELIPGPRVQGMIQTPDITSSTGVFAQEGLSGPLSPHMSMYTYTYPSKATKGTSVRAEGGPLELIRGFLGTELVRLVGGGDTLGSPHILAQVSLTGLSVRGTILRVKRGDSDAEWSLSFAKRGQPGPQHQKQG